MAIIGMALLSITNGLRGQELAARTQAAISAVMQAQEDSWNKGDLRGFMKGYWESDDLMFIGKSGVTRGWSKTLANYEKGYPSREAMGTLKFTILSMQQAGKGAAFVVGQWKLTREIGDLEGHFSLLWKKINGEWVIVADHSS